MAYTSVLSVSPFILFYYQYIFTSIVKPAMRDHCDDSDERLFPTFVPLMKDHLSDKTTLCGPVEWSLVTGFTVYF